MTFTILENGQQLDITKAQKTFLENQGLIYACGPCNGMYHIKNGFTFEDVDKALETQAIR